MVERTHFIAMDNFPREEGSLCFISNFLFSLGFVKTHKFMKSCPDEDMKLSKLFPSLILIKVETHTHAHAHRALETRKTN